MNYLYELLARAALAEGQREANALALARAAAPAGGHHSLRAGFAVRLAGLAFRLDSEAARSSLCREVSPPSHSSPAAMN